MVQRMTPEEQVKRIVYVQEWHEELVLRLLQKSASESHTAEETVSFVQRVADNENLSGLRGGDPAMDQFVAEAFCFESPDALATFKASLGPDTDTSLACHRP